MDARTLNVGMLLVGLVIMGCTDSNEPEGEMGCAPGEWKCSGNTPVQCSPPDAWVEFPACSALEMCVESPDGLEPACVSIVADGNGESRTLIESESDGGEAGGKQEDSEVGVPEEFDSAVAEEPAPEMDVEDQSAGLDGGDPTDGGNPVESDALETGKEDAAEPLTEPEDSKQTDLGEDASPSDASVDGSVESGVDTSDAAQEDAEEDGQVEGDSGYPDGDACEDEKQGGAFDETALQGKLLSAGLACQFPDDFGSIEHVMCLRDQFMETGIGPDCADCFSNFVLCFFAECGEACSDVENNPTPCTECVDNTICTVAFNACAGLNW